MMRVIATTVAALVYSATQAQSPEVQLDEVVVTAQKRAENLQEVPISVTALSGDQLEKLQIRGFQDLAGVVPNLIVSSPLGSGVPIFALRGVSMSDFSLSQDGPVATYYDEIYKGNPAIMGVGAYDLERIEVLKGPQGTLYGRNSTGGAVNLITRKPDFTNAADLSLGYGNYRHVQANGAGQIAISDALGFRGAFTYEDADGWFKNLSPGEPDLESTRQYGLRGTLRFRPNDGLDLVIRAATSKATPTAYGISSRPAGPDGIGAPLYPVIGVDGNPIEPDFRAGLGGREGFNPNLPKRRTKVNSVSATADVRLADSLTLTSISSWDRGSMSITEDAEGTQIQLLRSDYVGRTRQVAEDLRITSSFDGPFNFIVGGYYGEQKIFNGTKYTFLADADINVDGVVDAQDCIDGGFFPACQFANTFDQKKKTAAVYSDASYALTDRLTLRGGLRYTKDKGRQYNFAAVAADVDGTPLFNLIPGVDGQTAELSFKDNNVSGRLGIDFRITPDVMVYANYSTGYRGAGFNAQAFFFPEELGVAKPEKLRSMEVGFKSEWVGGTVRLNGALFDYRYKNQQTLNVDPVTVQQTLINLPKSSIRGGELEMLFRPVDRLGLSAALGFLDSEVKQGSVSGEDVSGNHLQNTPSFTATASIDWDIPVTERGVVTAHVDGSYTSSQYFDIQNRASMKEGDYVVLNGRLRFESPSGRYGVTVWGKNLTNKLYLTGGFDISGQGYLYRHVSPPRMYGVSFDARY